MRSIACGALLVLLGCGGAPSTPMPGPGNPTPAPGMPTMAKETQPFDQMFIDMMVPHHEGAVEMAKLARDRGEHAEIKVMADGIIASQEAEIGKMRAWRTAWYGSASTPSMSMPMSQPGMPGMSSMMNMSKDIEGLRTASPFDLAFLDAMVPHHQGAVEMSTPAADRADHAEIKELAAGIVRDQTREIAQMKAWRQAWYPAAVTSSPP